ncbi:MAG: HEXXH motif-containing putative peptide modification protein [Sandaracinus sp.]
MALPTGLLALPAPTDTRLRDLVRKMRLLVLRDLLARSGQGLSEPVRRALPRVQRMLIGAARAHPTETLEALGGPDALPPLLTMMTGVRPADPMLRAAIPALLASLARTRGVIEESVLWDVPFDALPLPGRGLARFEAPAQGLVANAAGVDVRLATGEEVRLDRLAATSEIHAIPGSSAHLALHDANPLAMQEEHPDKRGNAIDLGGRRVEEWTESLAAAIEMVRVALPVLHTELALSLHRIVPVGYEPERHLSASYREAPGLVYMTLHPSVLTLAEAIVHETQHGKLNVLSYFDPVLVNGRTTWTQSPVRPDLRPLSGVMLAVHAFVPVAGLHQRLVEIDHPISRTPEFRTRREQVLSGNARGLSLVHELGEPTTLGRDAIAALDALHDETRGALAGAQLDTEALPPG